MPLVADDLTLEWLNYALAPLLGNLNIIGFESKIIGVGEGFLGQLARLSLQLDSDDPSVPKTVIAKFASTKPETREFARDQNVYGREIGFYRDIGQEVGIKVPVVVRLEGTNVEKGREILKDSGLDFLVATDMADAAQKVVQAV